MGVGGGGAGFAVSPGDSGPAVAAGVSVSFANGLGELAVPGVFLPGLVPVPFWAGDESSLEQCCFFNDFFPVFVEVLFLVDCFSDETGQFFHVGC